MKLIITIVISLFGAGTAQGLDWNRYNLTITNHSENTVIKLHEKTHSDLDCSDCDEKVTILRRVEAGYSASAYIDFGKPNLYGGGEGYGISVTHASGKRRYFKLSQCGSKSKIEIIVSNTFLPNTNYAEEICLIDSFTSSDVELIFK